MLWLSLRCAAFVLAANPYLQQGRQLVDSLHYPEAEAKLRTASQVPTNTPEEKREIVDLLVRALVAQGRASEAESLYAEILAADPDASAPVGVAPKIRDTFFKAKQRVYPADFVRLEPLPHPPGRLAWRLVDPWRQVAQVLVLEREGAASFKERPLAPVGRQYGLDLPLLKPGEERALYVEARAADGRPLAAVASAEEPLTFSAPAAPIPAAAAPTLEVATQELGPPRWPKWLTGGLAVAALAVGTGFGVAAYRDNAAAGRAGPALDVRALDASARQNAIVANACVAGGLLAGAGTAVLAWKW